MANGSLFEVLEKRPNGWWIVCVKFTERRSWIGWAMPVSENEFSCAR
jgi:hypothetical protein